MAGDERRPDARRLEVEIFSDAAARPVEQAVAEQCGQLRRPPEIAGAPRTPVQRQRRFEQPEVAALTGAPRQRAIQPIEAGLVQQAFVEKIENAVGDVKQLVGRGQSVNLGDGAQQPRMGLKASGRVDHRAMAIDGIRQARSAFRVNKVLQGALQQSRRALRMRRSQAAKRRLGGGVDPLGLHAQGGDRRPRAAPHGADGVDQGPGNAVIGASPGGRDVARHELRHRWRQ